MHTSIHGPLAETATMSSRLPLIAVCMVFFSALVAIPETSSVFAAPAARPDPRRNPTPWEKGVSEKNQLAAERLLKQGKELFYRSRITKSRSLFQRAIRLWDHPIIEHALALTLIALGRNVVAYHHIKRALRYGAAPFGKEVHADVVIQLRLLKKRIARLRIRCQQPGLEVCCKARR